MRITIDAEETFALGGKYGCIWDIHTSVEATPQFREVANGALSAALDYLKGHTTVMLGDEGEGASHAVSQV